MVNRWAIEEESLLADMWQNVHEFHSNEGPFWEVLSRRFNEQSDGPLRNKNQIMGKWARMNCECQKFHQIYLNLQHTHTADVRLEATMAVFREQHGGQAFKYLYVWLILKNNFIWNRYFV